MTILVTIFGWSLFTFLGYIAVFALLSFAAKALSAITVVARLAGDAIGVACAWPIEKSVDHLDRLVAHGVEWRARRKIWRAEFRQSISWNAFQRQMASTPPQDEWTDALGLLALAEPFTRADLDARFKRIMQAVHPDKGGSEFLARLANEARALILKRKGWKR